MYDRNTKWYLHCKKTMPYFVVIMNAYMILDQPPFEGFAPSDLRAWLSLNFTESNLALAMEKVTVQVGMLLHDCDEYDDVWLDYCIQQWRELKLELKDNILRCLERDNTENGTCYPLTGVGDYQLIKPFMEKNGYRDGSGWWIKK